MTNIVLGTQAYVTTEAGFKILEGMMADDVLTKKCGMHFVSCQQAQADEKQLVAVVNDMFAAIGTGWDGNAPVHLVVKDTGEGIKDVGVGKDIYVYTALDGSKIIRFYNDERQWYDFAYLSLSENAKAFRRGLKQKVNPEYMPCGEYFKELYCHSLASSECSCVYEVTEAGLKNAHSHLFTANGANYKIVGGKRVASALQVCEDGESMCVDDVDDVQYTVVNITVPSGCMDYNAWLNKEKAYKIVAGLFSGLTHKDLGILYYYGGVELDCINNNTPEDSDIGNLQFVTSEANSLLRVLRQEGVE